MPPSGPDARADGSSGQCMLPREDLEATKLIEAPVVIGVSPHEEAVWPQGPGR